VALAGAGASGEAAPAMLGDDWSSKAPQQPQRACYSMSLTRTRYEFALCNSTASSGQKMQVLLRNAEFPELKIAQLGDSKLPGLSG